MLQFRVRTAHCTRAIHITFELTPPTVSLMDLGFSTHSFHMGARLVFMDATVAPDGQSLTFVTPPNGRVFPPGPATIFLTINDVSSEGAMVMMGSGAAPPIME